MKHTLTILAAAPPTEPSKAEQGQAQAAQGWQSIETAPKDRTEILACWPKRKLDDDECPTGEITGYAQCVTAWQGFWIEPDYLAAHGSFYFEDEAFADAPTHWMPLPAAPTNQEQNNG